MKFHLLHTRLFICALLSSAVQAELDSNNCEVDRAILGDPSLDRFNFSAEMAIDGTDCTYSTQFTFTHDESMPVPDDPAAQCDPSIQPPALAADGLPYYAFRWSYQEIPKKMQEAIGVNHISFDFNPCGHPPFDVFTKPHYDAHMYLVDTDTRLCMTCDLVPNAPVCDPAGQTTVNGKKFFNVDTNIIEDSPANMPPGYEVPPSDMVPLMGGHAMNVGALPTAATWTEPFWVRILKLGPSYTISIPTTLLIIYPLIHFLLN